MICRLDLGENVDVEDMMHEMQRIYGSYAKTLQRYIQVQVLLRISLWLSCRALGIGSIRPEKGPGIMF